MSIQPLDGRALGARLRALRVRHHGPGAAGQAALALALGTTRQAVAAWEAGVHRPGAAALLALAGQLLTTTDALLGVEAHEAQ